jgi:hypothetical protein
MKGAQKNKNAFTVRKLKRFMENSGICTRNQNKIAKKRRNNNREDCRGSKVEKEREKSRQKAKLKLAKERVGPTSFLIERVTRVYSSIYDRSPLV